MYWYSLFIFLVLTYGFGYLLTFFVKNSESFFERHLMRMGIGLGGLITVGLLLNILRIPLDHRILLGIMGLGLIAVLGYRYWKKKTFFTSKPSFNINPYIIGMLMLFAITFFMYHKGAFSYPYLENDDPWNHAVGAKYVSLEKTLFKPDGAFIRYMDPYPPGYDFLMGLLHQTNNSIFWTLKFFNALFVSLCIIFFYFFARQLFGNSRKALFATFALFAMPAFMSHFIWAIALTMPLFFTSFYAAERIREDKRWIMPAAIVIGATLAISPSHSTYFGLLFALYVIVRTFLARIFLWQIYAAGFFGVVLSAILWWVPSILRHGIKETVSIGANPTVFGIGGTADRQYSLADFALAKSQNLINNPIGLGMAISLLLACAIFFIIIRYKEKIAAYWKTIIPLFLGIFIAALLFLSYFYIRNVPKRNQPAAEVGSVPFMEFFGAQLFLIIGLAILLFTLITLLITAWKEKEFFDGHLALALAWLLFAFYAVNAGPFYIKLSPFRAWMILAIPVALLVAEGIGLLFSFTSSLVKGMGASKASAAASLVLLLIIGYGTVMTSFVQKYAVNTAQWSPGGFWTSGEEI